MKRQAGMTLKTFLDRLEKTPRDWSVSAIGRITRPGGPLKCWCPIEAVAGRSLNSEAQRDALSVLRLPLRVSTRIMASADYPKGGPPALRALLLRACGIPAASPSAREATA